DGRARRRLCPGEPERRLARLAPGGARDRAAQGAERAGLGLRAGRGRQQRTGPLRMAEGSGKPVVSIQGVTHRYGKVVALDAISLDIPPGRMVGIVGPDGVGKSTLMGIMAGSKKLQEGKMTVLDGDIGDVRHRRRVCPRIAYMPQGLGKN